MNTSNRIQISAPFERLFDLAADIARWPEILPHYRWVKILERKDGAVKAEMAARHRGLPLWWRTIQRPRPEEQRIYFTHIGGITKGMEVQWKFEPLDPGFRRGDDGNRHSGESRNPEAWDVSIEHTFHPRWPWPGTWFAQRVVGEAFVKQVANKTLNRIKELAEHP